MRGGGRRIPAEVKAFVREHYAEHGAAGTSRLLEERLGHHWDAHALAVWANGNGLRMAPEARARASRERWADGHAWRRFTVAWHMRVRMLPLAEVAAGVGLQEAHALALLRAAGHRTSRDGRRVEPKGAAWLASTYGPREGAQALRAAGWVPLTGYARLLGVSVDTAKRERVLGRWVYMPNVVRQVRCKHGRVWYHPDDVRRVMATLAGMGAPALEAAA